MRLHELNEGLDADQKRVGQVAGEESAKDISPVLGKEQKQHPFKGRLVGEDTVNEFAPGAGGGGDDGDEDPYKYPKPESYRRSIDFFGKFEADHFDREDMNDATGEFKGYWGKTQIAYFKFDNPAKTGSDDPGMGWYYEPNDISDDDSDTGATSAVDTSAQRKQQELGMIDAFLKSGQQAKPGSQIYSLMKRHGMAEGDNEKIADRYDQDEWDEKMQRLKKLAGMGPLKTVWDPVKRVYKNVPVNQKPEEK
jgi:hypothetical protein